MRMFAQRGLRLMRNSPTIRYYEQIGLVRELVNVADQPEQPCMEVRGIAAAHLGEVRRKLDELHALEANLAAFVASCDTACAGGAAVDCTILDDLAQPGAVARLAANATCCGASTRNSEGALQ